MKKKFTLEIAYPCSENFDKMIPNSEGSFCNSCAKNVIDLSRKTNSEVAKFISENKGENICARLKTAQLEEEFVFAEVSKFNNLKYAAVAASVLLVSNVSGQEKETVKTEISVKQSNDYLIGKTTVNQNSLDNASILMKGRLLESKSNKPFDSKKFPDLMLLIDSKVVKVNSKTGDFSVPLTILNDSETLQVVIISHSYRLSKVISLNLKDVKKNILAQDILIDEEELSRALVMIMGGLGINYIEENKTTREI